MIAKIIGIFFIIIGILWILKPQGCLDFIKKKLTKKIKFVLIGIAIFLGISLIKISFAQPNIIIKILMVVLGVIAILKGLTFVKARAMEKAIDFVARIPLPVLRALAVLNILIGIYFFFLK